MTISAAEIRAVRLAQDLTQQEFAEWLNERLDRKYNKVRISQWETAVQAVPSAVEEVLAPWTRLLHRAGPDRAKVIVVANQKGGVGKTTTSLNLAYALSQRGQTVLLIDLDPQANATLSAQIDRIGVANANRTIYNVLLKDADLPSIVQPFPDVPGLFIAPSGNNMDAAEPEMLSQTGAELILREKLSTVTSDYDYVILDCPPNLGKLTLNAMLAGRWLLIPTETASWSIAGIPLIIKNVEQVRARHRHDINVIGILPTKFNRRLAQDRASLDDITRDWGNRTHIFEPIKHTTAYPNSEAAASITLMDNPKAPGVMAYGDLADQILARIVRTSMQEAAE